MERCAGPVPGVHSNTGSLLSRNQQEVGFAHWKGIGEFDFEAEFQRWIEAISDVNDRASFSLQTMRLLASLGNGHTQFYDGWLHRTCGQPLGFELASKDEGYIVTRSAVPGLCAGDCIVTVDGEPAGNVFSEAFAHLSASTVRKKARLLPFRSFLLPTAFQIGLDSGAKVQVVRGQNHLSTSPAPTLNIDCLPVLKIPSFDSDDFERAAVRFVEQNLQSPAMIVDVRDNGGGNTPIDLLKVLMDRPFTMWLEETPIRTGLSYALRQDAKVGRFGPETSQPVTSHYPGKLAILVNEGTNSSAEDFVAPFKHNGRATIVGRSTAGSSGQPFIHDFGNEMYLTVSCKREYFPNGAEFEGVGISPDIHVEISREHLSDGSDLELKIAISHLKE